VRAAVAWPQSNLARGVLLPAYGRRRGALRSGAQEEPGFITAPFAAVLIHFMWGKAAFPGPKLTKARQIRKAARRTLERARQLWRPLAWVRRRAGHFTSLQPANGGDRAFSSTRRTTAPIRRQLGRSQWWYVAGAAVEWGLDHAATERWPGCWVCSSRSFMCQDRALGLASWFHAAYAGR
jgi:hypothetical protein